MNYLKMIGLTALSVMALGALAASSVSATTLEVTGTTQNKSVTIEATLESGSTTVIRNTDGTSFDTCSSSAFKLKTEGIFTGATVGGNLSTLAFNNCTHTTHVVKGGSLIFQHIAGTTNATTRSSGAQINVQFTSFGITASCSTNNVHVGTLTGSQHGHADLVVSSVINCGFFLPTAIWAGFYTVTSPTGLGASA